MQAKTNKNLKISYLAGNYLLLGIYRGSITYLQIRQISSEGSLADKAVSWSMHLCWCWMSPSTGALNTVFHRVRRDHILRSVISGWWKTLWLFWMIVVPCSESMKMAFNCCHAWWETRDISPATLIIFIHHIFLLSYHLISSYFGFYLIAVVVGIKHGGRGWGMIVMTAWLFILLVGSLTL
jgi:hypothetical protein